jgi:hypothetical protein
MASLSWDAICPRFYSEDKNSSYSNLIGVYYLRIKEKCNLVELFLEFVLRGN